MQAVESGQEVVRVLAPEVGHSCDRSEGWRAVACLLSNGAVGFGERLLSSCFLFLLSSHVGFATPSFLVFRDFSLHLILVLYSPLF